MLRGPCVLACAVGQAWYPNLRRHTPKRTPQHSSSSHSNGDQRSFLCLTTSAENYAGAGAGSSQWHWANVHSSSSPEARIPSQHASPHACVGSPPLLSAPSPRIAQHRCPQLLCAVPPDLVRAVSEGLQLKQGHALGRCAQHLVARRTQPTTHTPAQNTSKSFEALTSVSLVNHGVMGTVQPAKHVLHRQLAGKLCDVSLLPAQPRRCMHPEGRGGGGLDSVPADSHIVCKPAWGEGGCQHQGYLTRPSTLEGFGTSIARQAPFVLTAAAGDGHNCLARIGRQAVS